MRDPSAWPSLIPSSIRCELFSRSIPSEIWQPRSFERSWKSRDEDVAVPGTGRVLGSACERTGKVVHSGEMARSTKAKVDVLALALPTPDYKAPDVLLLEQPEQLRALGDDLRTRIVVLLRVHAHSITELAELLGLPKGTVGHHVKVLEKAGLVRVVRTRKVRALTERYYGRTARIFQFKSTDDAGGEDVRNLTAASLRSAAEEMLPPDDDDRTTFAVLRLRLTDADARRFSRRLERLERDFMAANNPKGKPYGLVATLFRRAPDA